MIIAKMTETINTRAPDHSMCPATRLGTPTGVAKFCVVGLRPLDAGHDLPRAFTGAGLHRVGDEEAWSEEREVGDALDAAGEVLVDE